VKFYENKYIGLLENQIRCLIFIIPLELSYYKVLHITEYSLKRSWLEDYKKRHSKENFLRINSSDDLITEKLKLLLEDRSAQDTLTILKELSHCIPFKKTADVLESIQGNNLFMRNFFYY